MLDLNQPVQVPPGTYLCKITNWEAKTTKVREVLYVELCLQPIDMPLVTLRQTVFQNHYFGLIFKELQIPITTEPLKDVLPQLIGQNIWIDVTYTMDGSGPRISLHRKETADAM